MAANGAQYGVATVNYYWIGAIPAMVFLGLVMMPFYYGSKVRSVPEYLLLRFNDAVAQVQLVDVRARDGPDRRREPVRARARAEAPARLADPRRHRRRGGHRRRPTSRLGGLSSAIYNEVLQFFVILAALIPIAIVGLHRRRRLERPEGQDQATPRSARPGLHALQGTTPGDVTNPIGVDLDRDRVRPRLRALVRLLDDELRRGPARAVGQGPVAPPSARR